MSDWPSQIADRAARDQSLVEDEPALGTFLNGLSSAGPTRTHRSREIANMLDEAFDARAEVLSDGIICVGDLITFERLA